MMWLVEEYREWPWSTRLLLPVWLPGILLAVILSICNWPSAAVYTGVMNVAASAFALNLALACLLEV